MLVDFEVENFRSYREAKRFSLVASSSEELPRNLIDTDSGLKLVRSTALYGPNASGKSNLLRAMDCVATFAGFPGEMGIAIVDCPDWICTRQNVSVEALQIPSTVPERKYLIRLFDFCPAQDR